MPFQAHITVKDAKKKISVIKLFIQWYDDSVPAYNTDADVEAALLEILPVIDNMIAGQIIHCSISRSMDLPDGLKTSPASTADVEEKANFVFLTPYSKPKITLPTIKDSLVVNGSDVLDESDEDVAMFIFLITDGSSTAWDFVRASDNRDVQIVSYQKAEERFRASGKRGF